MKQMLASEGRWLIRLCTGGRGLYRAHQTLLTLAVLQSPQHGPEFVTAHRTPSQSTVRAEIRSSIAPHSTVRSSVAFLPHRRRSRSVDDPRERQRHPLMTIPPVTIWPWRITPARHRPSAGTERLQ